MRQRCPTCPHREQPFVPGVGAPGGIAIVGEAPGVNEALKGEPFIGRSGQILRETLRAFGIDPRTVYITNAVGCHPPGNSTPTPKVYMGCREYLMAELREVQVSKILTVGGTALSAVVGSEKGLTLNKHRGLGMMVDIGGTSLTERQMALQFSALHEVYMVPTYHPAAILRDADLFRDFRDDVEKFLSHDHPLPKPRINTIIPKTYEEAETLLSWLQSASIISCDIETTGLNPLADRIISIGFGALPESPDYDGIAVLIHLPLFEFPSVRRELLNILDGQYQGKLVLHNLKFDWQFLEILLGKRLRPAYPADTMLMRYAQDERPSHGEDGRRGYSSHGLKVLARVRYDIPDYKMEFDPFIEKWEAGALSQKEWDDFNHYHSLDVYITAKLYGDLKTELETESPRLMKVCEDIFFPGAIALAEMELNGALIDVPYLTNLKTEVESRLGVLETEIKNSATRLSGQDCSNLNLNSTKQVSTLLFDWLHIVSSSRSTEREALQALAKKVPSEKGKLIGKLLEYRQWAKVKGTYIDGFLDRIDVDHRIRSDFLIPGTSTGRLSSSNPNLQNIPILIGPQLRRAFTAAPGWSILEADYSQLELRVVAWICRDPKLLQAYREGRDIHRLVASQMFHKPEEEITKLERYMAKYVDFGVIYGRQAKSLAEGWEMDYLEEHLGGKRWTIREAQFFLDQFLDGFPGLKNWILFQKASVRKNHYVESFTGRRRRFPLISNESAWDIERQAVNTPIQGGASDLCFTSLIRLNSRLDLSKAKVLFPVHDAIYFEVRDDCIDEIVPIIRDEMEKNLPIDMSIVPFRVDIKIGKRWGDAVELDEWRQQTR